ncbi:macrophage mannose receptor 1 [Oryzias melastigma]|uniref:macrophage mannose receptor 1 n=1 Tax=Oryzias melastigma TaxID=30732 RepID=UPI00168D6FAE|nr:macrophage mannose receptor 1 [Oryzias melastigma]
MDQLMETVSSAGYKSGFWIGLYIEINWRWSDGFSGSFTGNSYETSVNPSNCLSDQICMIVYWHSEHHHWSDSNCSSVFPFVCYNGTQQNPDYVFVNERMNWSSAQRYCRHNFTDLATLRNETDWTKLYSVTPIEQNVWIGLYIDTNISWSDGSNFSFSQKPTSSSLQPGVTTARCGYQYRPNTNDWYLYPCEYRYPFVCCGLPKVSRRVKLRLKVENSDLLSDAAVKEKLLEKLQEKLEENGVSGVKLKWKQTTDGKVFNREKKKKTEL